MNTHQRQRLMQRWEAVLNELADIDHLRVINGDPPAREEELQAELGELEFRLTEGGEEGQQAA